jgi:hypothetical protein
MPEFLRNRTDAAKREIMLETRLPKQRASYARAIRLLLGLEVVEEDAALLGLLTPILDNDARAVDDLAGVALTVNLACSRY